MAGQYSINQPTHLLYIYALFPNYRRNKVGFSYSQKYEKIKNTITLILTQREKRYKPKKKQNIVNNESDRTDLLTPQVLDRIAELIKQKVIDRTLTGYDYAGQKFVPYTPGYAKIKGVRVDEVNLKLSGGMLNDFYVRVKRTPDHEKKDVFFIDLGAISIHYGFETEFASDKYFWNADNQYGNHRDFLGAHQGVPLMPQKELMNLIQQAIREEHKK